MKFTAGYWQLRPGVEAIYARTVEEVEIEPTALVVIAPDAVIRQPGDTVNRPLLTLRFSSPLPGVIRVQVAHHLGGREPLRFVTPVDQPLAIEQDGDTFRLSTGELGLTVRRGHPFRMEFTHSGKRLTGATERSIARVTLDGRAHVFQQLGLGVGELIFGLGERFGPLVKNGQSIEIWNEDGGTNSDLAYKNVPFYLSNAGYGVFVNQSGPVSFEVGTVTTSAVQFSAPGETLEYFVIDGPSPKKVLERYTAITGRPPALPSWTYGLWLSTSFTTQYDETTAHSFIAGFEERRIPLSVFHYDCFWMRQFHWCDFEWDPVKFPDPRGMLARLHDRGLKVCLWVNPYIAQRSAMFREGCERGYLVRRPDGSVWQWDMWQAGMGLVDFTNPAAAAWYQSKLAALLEMGVDCFKTDFGERVPTDVVWADGSDPEQLHNYYAFLYNKCVFDLLRQRRGEGEAIVFARSATAGGQQFPVHWGGDSESTFESMAETLRGGLSLALSGFGYWSHDIGGFDGDPDPELFKRWCAFGLLSSHSRLHGASSYRVPWDFGDEAVDVLRHFVEQKANLMPYLTRMADEVQAHGWPIMRPMVLEFPDDAACAWLDRQYMLGDALLVAPVFTASGEVEYYLPAGTWTRLNTGEPVDGGRWIRETHSAMSLPLLVRPGHTVG